MRHAHLSYAINYSQSEWGNACSMFIRVTIRNKVYEIHEGAFASDPELTPKMFFNQEQIRDFYKSCLDANSLIETQYGKADFKVY
ncbi:hypothetical protein [Spartinivicinus ruber]|uniref:hypothetical protein n=1 Tax=Spartinivicinus ruber TaxID=2683272 RepID=UPI0013D4E01B|nr:hypothetical protein [Spartinivicinus ruber]